MALFLTRVGRQGEYEEKFLKDGRIYSKWDGVIGDLNVAHDMSGYFDLFLRRYSGESRWTVRSWARQAMLFCRGIEPGDWVVLPSKLAARVHFGKVLGPCEFLPDSEGTPRNSRVVEWFAPNIPRCNFDQDILNSFGALLTTCRIKRNNSESRIKEMAENNWHVLPPSLNRSWRRR